MRPCTVQGDWRFFFAIVSKACRTSGQSQSEHDTLFEGAVPRQGESQ